MLRELKTNNNKERGLNFTFNEDHLEISLEPIDRHDEGEEGDYIMSVEQTEKFCEWFNNIQREIRRSL